MEKYIYDNSNGLWYELHGDYYLPCLVIPEKSTPLVSGAESTSSISENIILWSKLTSFSAVSCIAISLILILRLAISSTCS